MPSKLHRIYDVTTIFLLAIIFKRAGEMVGVQFFGVVFMPCGITRGNLRVYTWCIITWVVNLSYLCELLESYLYLLLHQAESLWAMILNCAVGFSGLFYLYPGVGSDSCAFSLRLLSVSFFHTYPARRPPLYIRMCGAVEMEGLLGCFVHRCSAC